LPGHPLLPSFRLDKSSLFSAFFPFYLILFSLPVGPGAIRFHVTCQSRTTFIRASISPLPFIIGNPFFLGTLDEHVSASRPVCGMNLTLSVFFAGDFSSPGNLSGDAPAEALDINHPHAADEQS